VLSPGTPLPAVFDSVTIDGTTQPGYTDTPMIVIDGTSMAEPSTYGLALLVDNAIARALEILNFGDGVYMDGSNNILEGLLVTENGNAGVAIAAGTQNAVTFSRIYDNGGLGIDLGDDGVTLNDPGDGDGSPLSADTVHLSVWYDRAGVPQIVYDTGAEQPLLTGNVTVIR